jgi:hypothetical protein
MITPSERAQLRKILKNDYTNDVIQGLKENDLKVYSKTYIRRVFNNGINNADIEMVIWKVASVRRQQQLEKKLKVDQKKKEFLNN